MTAKDVACLPACLKLAQQHRAAEGAVGLLSPYPTCRSVRARPPSACSHYGNQEGLKELVAALKAEGIIPVADIVINHRCADEKDEHTGVYNRFRWATARRKLRVQPGSRGQPLDLSQTRSAEACGFCFLPTAARESSLPLLWHAQALCCISRGPFVSAACM